MVSLEALPGSAWTPSVSFDAFTSLPTQCGQLDLIAQFQPYDLELNQPYVVTTSAIDDPSANFTVKGVMYYRQAQFDGQISSDLWGNVGALRVGTTELESNWTPMEGGPCAVFTFWGVVPVESSSLHVQWLAKVSGANSDGNPIALVSSATLVGLNATSATTSSDGSTAASTVPSSIAGVTSSTAGVTGSTAGVTSSTAAPSSGTTEASDSSPAHSSKKLAVLVPAIVVPIVVLLVAGVAALFFLRRRRRRMAPSAAFREDHLVTDADVAQIQSTSNLLVASGSAPRSASPYFPLDGKRPLLES